MKRSHVLCTLLVALVSAARADVAPVAVRVPRATAWLGQRVSFYVELRAPGTFEGTAGFDLPRLPGTFLMKIGNPVVSSRDLEGRSWFVQAHEFALFSQKPGLLEVPPFPVRFASREGFTGPAKDTRAETPAWTVEIRSPPGGERLGFLITTEALEVTDAWKPEPRPARVGTVFQRTIVQRARDVSGIALAPPPTVAPAGIRVYAGQPEVNDTMERGELIGERRDTITYLLREPGSLALPALTYVWWDPAREAIERKTLPAVTLEVAPPAPAATGGEVDDARPPWPWWLVAVSALGLGAWQRRRLSVWMRQGRKVLNPPDRAAGRRLLRACRRRDTAGAEKAWSEWRRTQGASFQPGPELRSALVGLHRRLFGPAPSASWDGEAFVRAFRGALAAGKATQIHKRASALPSLNPREGGLPGTSPRRGEGSPARCRMNRPNGWDR